MFISLISVNPYVALCMVYCACLVLYVFVDDVEEVVEVTEGDTAKVQPNAADPKTAWSEEVTSDLSKEAEGQFSSF